jgi:hypothetical protein
MLWIIDVIWKSHVLVEIIKLEVQPILYTYNELSTYKIHAPFIKYASCIYEWALWNNFWKYQVVIQLICTNLTMENI